MTVLNTNKLSFYVLLLAVAFAQILAVSALEDTVADSDDKATSDSNFGARPADTAKSTKMVFLSEFEFTDRTGEACLQAATTSKPWVSECRRLAVAQIHIPMLCR
ncbi:hypothetical protein BD769DRAFT_1641100 [Suillus cothurnatus]|nr:hypothetical protein BD769DRAFT_1641100 [Suillus cothurnatus]